MTTSYKTVVLLLTFWLFKTALGAQSTYSIEMSGDYKNTTLIEVLLDLEKRYPVHFYYEPNSLPYYKVNYKFQNQTLFYILQKFLPPNGLISLASGENGIIICRQDQLKYEGLDNLVKKWAANEVKLPDFLTPLLIEKRVGEPTATPKRSVTISGQLIDEKTKDPIIGISVQGDTIGKGAVTDILGKFSLQLKPGVHNFKIEYIGYRETHLNLTVFESGDIGQIELETRALELAGVEITGTTIADKQKSVATGVEMLSSQTIKDLPAILGEADVLKSLLVLPGVTTVGEGTAGYNVRGGNVDQNLIIQDDIPFFNSSHLLGFFSVFNPDMVRSATLYKGHIPARYGGRVASALDVRLRDGDYSTFKGSAGLSFASAKINLEGPIVKDKVSFLGGFRTSYSDWMLKIINNPTIKTSSARFDDLNAKIAARIGKNGSLTVGAHRSTDYFRYAKEFGYQWKTTGANISWRQGWSEEVLTTVSFAAGEQKNTYFQPEGTDAFDLNNGLQFATAVGQLRLLKWEGHEITTGLQWNLNAPQDQSLTPSETSSLLPRSAQSTKGREFAFFADDEFKLRSNITLSAGLRWSLFSTTGNHASFLYEPGIAPSLRTLTDTLQFQGPSKWYQGPEPRVSVNYQYNRTNSFKLSYNLLRQYLHQISNTVAPTPADVWQVSNRYIEPQVAHALGAGWFYTPEDKRWETSAELFFRNTEHVLIYKDFADLLLNNHLETEVSPGSQRSYGLECLFRKNEGRWTGWASYTYGRVWQKTDTPFRDFQVNRNSWFPANFDQPHQGVVYAKFAINPAFFWTFNFTYRTGRPVTAPQTNYPSGTVFVPNFSDRNTLRIRDYHRLDIGLSMDQTRSRLAGLKWSWGLSIYNVYARKNPFSVYFKRNAIGRPAANEFSVIGVPIPSVVLTAHW